MTATLADVMHAAVVAGPRRVDIVEPRIPAPVAGHVRVRIEGCGVCASSLPVWDGRPWFSYPLPAGEPGHEGWGFVDAVGPDVETPAEGDRVAVLSYHAFAQYDIARADHCVVLPPEVAGLPMPLEPVGCAVNVVQRAGVRHGEPVAVVGAGFLGRLVIALVERAGAPVVVFRRGDDVAPTPFDRVIECAGTQGALDTASALIGERGRLVLAGFHQDGSRTVDLQGWNWRGIDVVNAHERDAHVVVAGMREAAALVAAGGVDLEPLLTHRFPLTQLADAFEAAATRPEGFVKAWVEL